MGTIAGAARTRDTNLGHRKQSLGDQNADVAANRAARSIAWILLTALAAVWVVASFNRFKNLDPRFDQSGNAVISLQMSRADHLFPRRAFRGQPIANAMEADRSSWLRAPARTYIIEPLVVFDATSIFTNYVAMKLWRPTYRTTIFTSIAFRTLAALLIAAWSAVLLGKRSISLWYVAFFVGGLLTLVCAYSTYFSPWGAHNFAVTFLVIALFCLERTLPRWGHGDLRWPALLLCGVTQVLALYSYSTCTLLLLLAVPMSIMLVRERPWKDRFVASLGYILFVLLVDSPVLIRFHGSPTYQAATLIRCKPFSPVASAGGVPAPHIILGKDFCWDLWESLYFAESRYLFPPA